MRSKPTVIGSIIVGGIIWWGICACVPSGIIVDAYHADQQLTASAATASAAHLRATQVAVYQAQATENVRQQQAQWTQAAAMTEQANRFSATQAAATPTAFALALLTTSESRHATATAAQDATQESLARLAADYAREQQTQRAQAAQDFSAFVVNVGKIGVSTLLALLLGASVLIGRKLFDFAKTAIGAWRNRLRHDAPPTIIIVSKPFPPQSPALPAPSHSALLLSAEPEESSVAAPTAGIPVRRGGVDVASIIPMTESEIEAQTKRRIEALSLLRAALDFQSRHPDYPRARLPGAAVLGWSGSRWQRHKDLLADYLEARDGNQADAGTWVKPPHTTIAELLEAVRASRVKI